MPQLQEHAAIEFQVLTALALVLANLVKVCNIVILRNVIILQVDGKFLQMYLKTALLVIFISKFERTIIFHTWNKFAYRRLKIAFFSIGSCALSHCNVLK